MHGLDRVRIGRQQSRRPERDRTGRGPRHQLGGQAAVEDDGPSPAHRDPVRPRAGGRARYRTAAASRTRPCGRPGSRPRSSCRSSSTQPGRARRRDHEPGDRDGRQALAAVRLGGDHADLRHAATDERGIRLGEDLVVAHQAQPERVREERVAAAVGRFDESRHSHRSRRSASIGRTVTPSGRAARGLRTAALDASIGIEAQPIHRPRRRRRRRPTRPASRTRPGRRHRRDAGPSSVASNVACESVRLMNAIASRPWTAATRRVRRVVGDGSTGQPTF